MTQPPVAVPGEADLDSTMKRAKPATLGCPSALATTYTYGFAAAPIPAPSGTPQVGPGGSPAPTSPAGLRFRAGYEPPLGGTTSEWLKWGLDVATRTFLPLAFGPAVERPRTDDPEAAQRLMNESAERLREDLPGALSSSPPSSPPPTSVPRGGQNALKDPLVCFLLEESMDARAV